MPLRLIALASNVAFITYGYLGGMTPILLLHAVLLPLNGLAAASAVKACLPDAERLCAHLPPGARRGRACMRRNADRLSKRCHDALFGEEPFNGRR